MKVLIVGGSGFLSRVVAEGLRDAGHEVTVFTRGVRPLPEGVRAITGNRNDADGFALQFEGRSLDAVIDCICYTPEDAHADLRAFAGRVGHFVMISTDFVYGPRRQLPIDEETPTRALNTYGRNKAACEEMLLAAHREEGFPVTILRPPHIMGAGGHLGSGSLQGRDPMLLDRISRRRPIVLLDGGALLIQPVVHRDIARACGAVLGRAVTLGQAYNTAGPDCVTTRQYYDLIAATLGVEAPEYLSLPSDLYVRAFPERAPFAFHRMYATTKLERDAGCRPQTTLPHAVFETIDWLQASGSARPCEETEQEAAIATLCRTLGEEALRVLSPPAAA